MHVKLLTTATLVVAVSACAGIRGTPIPPRPEIVEIEPPEVADFDFSDPAGLEPAPFAEPPGDSIPTSDNNAPADLDLTGTTIPLEINPRVQYWLDVFTGRERDRFALYLSRQGRFVDMIESKLSERGLPPELIYLAMIESGFSPIARSKARAVGMWQFIAGTARIEGLEVSEYLDERRDVERSTDAAINHLERLHNRFGSWYLAAAAYNSGEGRVSRAMNRRAKGEDGSDELFWKIHEGLPRETRDYVPKLIAATIIGRNREQFGFGDVIPLAPEPVDRVMVDDAADLDVIAKAAGVPASVVAEMNPHLPRQVTPPNRETEVFLPEGTADQFQVAFAKIPAADRVRFLEHTVRKGETLSQIARRYGSSVSLIQQTNGLRSANRLSIGQRLRIPRGTGLHATTVVATSQAARVATRPTATGPITYHVKRGDTLWAIARRHGVSTAELMEWNSLNSRSILKPGDRLIIRTGN
jgi:peptidoglycan lytic transglycosylase D